MFKMMLVALVIGLTVPVLAGESLEQILADRIIADYDLNPDLVTIKMVRSDIKTETPEEYDIEIDPLIQSSPKGRFPIKITLYKDGAMAERGSVSLDVRLFADLPVPVRNIKRHEVLTLDMFEMERFDITSQSEPLLTDLGVIDDCRAGSNLAAGKMVPLRRIQKIPDVENGETVTLIGASDLFEIRTKGLALQNGNVGESIRVKNIDSKKILNGVVASPGIVEIAL